jgi:hypothetical protein
MTQTTRNQPPFDINQVFGLMSSTTRHGAWLDYLMHMLNVPLSKALEVDAVINDVDIKDVTTYLDYLEAQTNDLNQVRFYEEVRMGILPDIEARD